jgi:AcrR family transcriptional regulator
VTDTARRRSDKRRDLLDGALEVFAADGYTRASIDAIARAAGVSSRTIYNQFGDKAGLFEAVIVDSARRVADVQVALADRLLGGVPGRTRDIESTLVGFGRVWATADPEFATHFALVRQVRAEVGHVPADALRAWQDEGPLRVRRAVADHLRRMAEAGLLDLPDADLAANHLIMLVATEAVDRARDLGAPPDRAEIHRLADAGVRTFLHGNAPGLRRTRSTAPAP